MTFLSIQKYFNRVHKFKAVKNGIQEQSAFVKKTTIRSKTYGQCHKQNSTKYNYDMLK